MVILFQLQNFMISKKSLAELYIENLVKYSYLSYKSFNEIS